MHAIGVRIATAVVGALMILCVAGDSPRAQVQTVVIFEETFPKDAAGTLEYSRTFSAVAGPVTVSFTNGTAGNFDIVRNGRIAVN
jgi:hypothetical protein